MLKLELEREGFKRYTNGKGYKITVSEKDFIKYRIFKDNDISNYRYLPEIIELNEKDEYSFRFINSIHINDSSLNIAIEELERYLEAYRIAKESIEEFKKAIINNEL